MVIDGELLADREVVLRIVRKQREVLEGEEGKQVFALANDPTKPGLVVNLKVMSHKNAIFLEFRLRHLCVETEFPSGCLIDS